MNLEHNIKLALYEGFKKKWNTYYLSVNGEQIALKAEELTYDTDFSDLMIIVEKIEYDFPVSIMMFQNICYISQHGLNVPIISVEGSSKINAVYSAVVFFLDRYVENGEFTPVETEKDLNVN